MPPLPALPIRTFDNATGRSVFFKAIGHPRARDAVAAWAERLTEAGRLALFDPAGRLEELAALAPIAGWDIAHLFVQKLEEVGAERRGLTAEPATEIAGGDFDTLVLLDFDTARLRTQIAPYLRDGARLVDLDPCRLPADMLTVPLRTLDPLNYAADFVLFRHGPGFGTRIETQNYWHNHGARGVRLWFTLFDADGNELARWDEALPARAQRLAIESGAVAARFGLGAFQGQLHIHASGVAGHDTLKYVLDIDDGAGGQISCTHDSNPWPADTYAGLPAPRPGERAALIVQNPLPVPIPPGGVALKLAGTEEARGWPEPIPPFGTASIDPARLFPEAAWPAQFVVEAGRRFGRPRYELTRDGNRAIAHVNVLRRDLKAAPDLAEATRRLGGGFILPAAILPIDRWTLDILPTPMSGAQTELALVATVRDAKGSVVARHRTGLAPASEVRALSLDEILAGAALPGGTGHLELTYDFEYPVPADGWMHAIFRYTRRDAPRDWAETSFGSHMYNVGVTWRSEPQSYLGAPPGLSTRLFLRVPPAGQRLFWHLIYPSSASWRPHSATRIALFDGMGDEVVAAEIAIPLHGSRHLTLEALFTPAQIEAAGANAHLIVRDTSCRLFGYHGVEAADGSVAVDHMFGF